MRPPGPAAFIFLHILSSWKLTAACSGVEIIGGKEVKPHSSPWMVSIQGKGKHICGGVLIKDQWVLTAAHCERAFGQCTAVEAVLGAHSLGKDTNIRLGVEACIKSRTFNENSKADDIMLIKLKTKVKAKRKMIKAKDLPKSGKDVSVGTSCQVTGWGITNEKDKVPSDTLQGVEVKIEDRDLCSCYYNNNPTITMDMLCAGNKKAKADACFGDSGGPLLCKKVLVGVVSGGRGCGNPKKPGVYTRLSDRHLTWIKNVMKHRSNVSASQTDG
ncbi:hypothetical protein SKAU_G00355610 [Synaphobranchus kaupii]|uniref:Peptidase S1 domain-containing protein n=1 Tax=Synaphobranchus kaupii TaxID=118154 RepID=A0A9Q1IFL2_SYNKA|nr:hypothetical protein SKAU_G00355610 [Synaphobranchus kaupii]